MNEFLDKVDRLMAERLVASPDEARAYQQDAEFHAAWQTYRTALVRAHVALVAAGWQQADELIAVLAKGLPDPGKALQRVESRLQLARDLAGFGPRG